jgi:DHA2 family multidrug resistance protein-like MFS transporter
MTVEIRSPPSRSTARVVHDDGLPTPLRYWSMLAIAVGISMSVLDGSVANIALPSIARALRTTPAESIWVVNAYQLAIVMTLLPLASLGEQVGYRRVYQVGLLIFTLGSLACALSTTFAALVIARSVQGLGAAGVMSVNGALVRFTYPRSSLGRGIGLNALVVSIAAALGPSIASAVLAVGSWQWLFAINVPIGLLNSPLAARALPESDRSGRPFDWTSALLNAVVFGLFFLGVDAFTHLHGGGEIAACLLLTAFAAGAYLVKRQARAARPLIPIDLLRIRVFALSIAVSICAFTAYTLAFVALPFYFESVLHKTQVQTGLLMTPWPAALAFMAPLAGRLSDRIPAGLLGGIGLVMLSSGLALLATLTPHATAFDIGWRMAVCGLGFGLFQSPNNRTLLSSAPRARSGAAGGMLATARLIGMTTGAALAALVFRVAPAHSEMVSLFMGAGLGILAAVASALRLATTPHAPAIV